MWWRQNDPIEEIIRRIERDFEDLIRLATPTFMGSELHSNIREPLIDIIREKDELVITIELPGVRKEDINIRFLDKRRLYIQVSVNNKLDRNLENAVYIERRYSEFRRVITLPVPVLPETAKAKLNNGVLEVRVKIDDKEMKKLEGVPVRVE